MEGGRVQAGVSLKGRLRPAAHWVALFLEQDQERIIALAEDRYELGKELYPDRPLYSKTRDQLEQEIAEELADALVYARRRLDTQ